MGTCANHIHCTSIYILYSVLVCFDLIYCVLELTLAMCAIYSTGKLYGVLGSSIGWHVFYGALTWQVCVCV